MGTFVFTGGHHNSALVLAQYFVSQKHTVYWYGHKKSSRKDQNDSAEYVEVTASKIKFLDLPAGRATLNISELLRLPYGFIVALKYLIAHQPSAVISFGGYLGATTALAAYILGISVYLHEQTVVAGKANKFISKLARRVYLTWHSSLKFFPKKKSLVVGLPLRSSIIRATPKKLFDRKRPTLLVMGGKQGAHAINHFIFEHLRDLLIDFNLIHQTGTSSETGDYEQALALRGSLGSLADSYLPIGYITENEIGYYLKSANYYLGRSGAHITYELLLLGLKAVLVPLSFTHQREQYKNALELVKVKQAVVLSQSDLSLKNLRVAIKELKQLRPEKYTLSGDATEKVYNDIKRTL
ncbi:MAG: hypothetical protein DPW11_03475 [bacterium]|nr:hypothetical protein [Candidatus Microgenomates bacterium CPR3]MCQ3944810.1 hypothetical protein [bacterium]RIK51591.1 MAG: hypothetical protein DCC61_02065 [Candidatus Microgenomates bacterium]